MESLPFRLVLTDPRQVHEPKFNEMGNLSDFGASNQIKGRRQIEMSEFLKNSLFQILLLLTIRNMKFQLFWLHGEGRSIKTKF